MAINSYDIVSTLQALGMMKYWKGKHIILKKQVSTTLLFVLKIAGWLFMFFPNLFNRSISLKTKFPLNVLLFLFKALITNCLLAD